MNNKKNNFLFYTDWEHSVTGSASALAGTLAAFATEFGLSGNVWQQWLTYILMMHDNAFTLACERREILPDSTLMQLAERDLAIFMELFRTKETDFDEDEGLLPLMLDYKAPYEGDCSTDAGRRIKELSCRLAGAEDVKEFARTLTDHYEKYGAGMYGLYKAFRVDPAADGAELKLIPVTDSADVCFDDLIGYESQKKTLRDNTEAFVSGHFANNVLLYGDSGTGKSTSVHALMHDYADRGLRLIEVSKPDRSRLPQILSAIKKRNYRFILFLDDLSFEENESDYKELKAMLEGALETRSDKVLIYATSNRRHLIRETWGDRSDMEYNEDVHRSDTMEEKLSLAGRFGVTIYYPKPGPKDYLEIVRGLAARKGIELSGSELEDAARKWELRHGGMSGRAASQLITWLDGTDK
ncbi:MAG: ATP-binding protein [Mogibacterium sp.]|nr:ATP-binding protein [Mogibacterium sp.]MBR4089602.1 ATP-binding protein [Mogibacterium sp.]